MYHHLQPNIKYEVIYLKQIMLLLRKLLQCGHTYTHSRSVALCPGLPASSLFNLHAWVSVSTTSLLVFFDLSLGLGPSASYSMHFFTQSSSSFRNTCPYYHSPFCCNTSVTSLIPNLSQLLTCKSVFYLNATHSSTWRKIICVFWAVYTIHLCCLFLFVYIMCVFVSGSPKKEWCFVVSTSTNWGSSS